MSQGKFILAENGIAIIGYAYLQPCMEASRLEFLAVSPQQQRAGIGSQLLEAAERLSSSMRCLFMHVQVVSLNWETLKFCRRRGYVEFAIAPLHRQQTVSPHCHIVRMCKQLDKDRSGF
jgi:ribosomal protein S18 acetylase RimI-like enzyme